MLTAFVAQQRAAFHNTCYSEKWSTKEVKDGCFLLMGYRHIARFLKPLEMPNAVNKSCSLFFFFQGYNSHTDEDDPERIQMIIQRALGDAQWILDKVNTETF